MYQVLSYKYGDFKVNGVPVFGCTLYDGSTELQILVGNLKEMEKHIGIQFLPSSNSITSLAGNDEKTDN